MVKKINNMERISPVDIPVMRLYLDGVPCRSTVLVRPIAHLRGIRNRKSELITGMVENESFCRKVVLRV